jgi:DNA-binding CsgD family transcriptional regulator
VYDPEAIQEYIARNLGALEAPQWNYLNSRPPLDLVLDDRAGIPREVLDVRADYVFNREKLGIGRRVALRLNAIPAWYDAAIFAFGVDHLDIPQAALDGLRPLLPHLAKAVEVGRAFAMLRARYQAALAALDRMGVGLAIALPSGELIVHNAEAARIFSRGDGLCRGRDGHLRCRRRDQLERIELAIREAAGTLRGIADRPEALEVVDRPSGLHAFLVEVTPLADSGGEIERCLAGALVTIIDPDNVQAISVRRFAALSRLTPAEAEVCELIVQGASGAEIAERRGTTPETAKTQIRAIMAKTGGRGRGDLIRLVLRTIPPVQ